VHSVCYVVTCNTCLKLYRQHNIFINNNMRIVLSDLPNPVQETNCTLINTIDFNPKIPIRTIVIYHATCRYTIFVFVIRKFNCLSMQVSCTFLDNKACFDGKQLPLEKLEMILKPCRI
jgi:hypothetical protein